MESGYRAPALTDRCSSRVFFIKPVRARSTPNSLKYPTLEFLKLSLAINQVHLEMVESDTKGLLSKFA